MLRSSSNVLRVRLSFGIDLTWSDVLGEPISPNFFSYIGQNVLGNYWSLQLFPRKWKLAGHEFASFSLAVGLCTVYIYDIYIYIEWNLKIFVSGLIPQTQALRIWAEGESLADPRVPRFTHEWGLSFLKRFIFLDGRRLKFKTRWLSDVANDSCWPSWSHSVMFVWCGQVSWKMDIIIYNISTVSFKRAFSWKRA